MGRVLVVAWREFKATALTKAFAFAAIGVPALVVALLFLMPLLTRPNLTPLSGTIAVASADPAVIEALRVELAPAGMGRHLAELTDEMSMTDPGTAGAEELVAVAAAAARPAIDLAVEEIVAAAPGDAGDPLAEAKDRVRRGELVAVAEVPLAAMETDPERQPASFTLFVPPNSPPNHTMILRRAVADAIARARAAAAGLDYDDTRSLLRAPDADVRRLAADGGEATERVAARLLIPVAFMMLLWMSVFVSAQYLLTTTIEEKSSKVMEVLLSAVSPMQLMAGKILGQGMVSAVMLLAYGSLGLVGLGVLASLDLVPGWQLALLVVYFVMAYFMIASLMAGVGSAVNDMHEAQSLIGPVMLMLSVPLMLWFPISENPNGMLATVTSFVPPLIPFVMILRVTASNDPVSFWQIALSIVWGFTAMLGMMWMAARIFRVGVLMQGKTPTPRELVRWVGYR